MSQISKLTAPVLAGALATMIAGVSAVQAQQIPNRQNLVFPQGKTVDIRPAEGERKTVDAYHIMVAEVIGPGEGAKLLASGEVSSLFSSTRFPAGAVYERFGRGEPRIYCATEDTPGNSGGKNACLVDRTGDGTFDEFGRLDTTGDWFNKKSADDLDAPIAYEVVEVTDPSFQIQMRVDYEGKDDNGNPVLATTGYRQKGAKIPDPNMGRAKKHTIGAFSGERAVQIEGISLMIHEVTDDTITFTYMGGTFDQAHFRHRPTRALVTYGR